MKIFTIRLPDKMIKHLEARAAEFGLTRSEYLRVVIMRTMEEADAEVSKKKQDNTEALARII